MKANLQKLVEAAKSASEVAESLAKEGIRSVEGAWKGMGLCRSLSALEVSELEKDETHYVLVPFPGEEREEAHFVLFSKRVIAEGHGVVNSLPKERIFHLPDLQAEERLREQLTSSLTKKEETRFQERAATLAERLESLAEEVDRETDKVSGGLLLVGGVTTLLNPIAGIGILASGVLPSVGGKLAKSGASLAGDHLRDWSAKRQEKLSRKEAESEVAKLKPTVFVNPVLRTLDAALTNPTGKEDPLLEGGHFQEGFPNQRYFIVTAEAIGQVYGEVLQAKKSRLRGPVRTWLESVSASVGDS